MMTKKSRNAGRMQKLFVELSLAYSANDFQFTFFPMKVVMTDARRLNTSFDLKALPFLYVSKWSKTIFLYFREFVVPSAESSATRSVKICSTRTACKVSKRRFISYCMVLCTATPDTRQLLDFFIKSDCEYMTKYPDWISDIKRPDIPSILSASVVIRYFRNKGSLSLWPQD